MLLRDAARADFAAILALNQAFVAVLSPLDEARLAQLHAQAALHRVAVREGVIVAFLLALREGACYDSPNYRWFAQRCTGFLYVDRIVVAQDARGVGTALYRDAFGYARQHGLSHVTCEFDIEPPNPASERFHHKLGFAEVGRQQLYDDGKTVSLQALDLRAGASLLARD